MPAKNEKIATHESTRAQHPKESTVSTPTPKKSHSRHETTTPPVKETPVMSTSLESR